MNVSAVRWRKSSRSNYNQNCVEVASTLDAVRDSKNPTGPALVLRPAALAALLDAVKDGQLDL